MKLRHVLQLNVFVEPTKRELRLLAQEPPAFVVPLIMQKIGQTWQATPLWQNYQTLLDLITAAKASTKLAFEILLAICEAAIKAEEYLIPVALLPLRFGQVCFWREKTKLSVRLLLLPSHTECPNLAESPDLLTVLCEEIQLDSELLLKIRPLWLSGDWRTLKLTLLHTINDKPTVNTANLNHQSSKASSTPKISTKKQSWLTRLVSLKQSAPSPNKDQLPIFFPDDELEKTKPLTPDPHFHLACLSDVPPLQWSDAKARLSYILVDEFSVGRDSHKVDFAIKDLTVSKRHASIKWHGGYYFIQDVGSKNGTWLNESRLAKFEDTILPNSCRLRFGDTHFFFNTDSILNRQVTTPSFSQFSDSSGAMISAPIYSDVDDVDNLVHNH